MKKSVLMLSLATSLICMSPLAHADLNKLLQDVNAQAVADIKAFNANLSRQFGIPVPNVEAIISQVPKPADAFMILQLGQMAHKEPDLVLQTYQRNKSKGWGAMAKELGIKPGSPEFHALKSGNLHFAGSSAGAAPQPGADQGQGQGRGHGHGHGKGHGND